MDEIVLCFNTRLLDERAPSTAVFYDKALWREILASLEPIPRSIAESDYGHKQLVVYVAVESQDRFLRYERTSKTAESRLKMKRSVGLGGHVNLRDRDQLTLFGGDPTRSEHFVLEAMKRELDEEVQLLSPVRSGPDTLCFINDDSDDVGRVHFGVVGMLRIDEPLVRIRGERGIGQIGFHPLEDLVDDDALESWSRLLVKYLTKERPR